MNREDIIQDFFLQLSTIRRIWMKQHADTPPSQMPTHAQMGILMTIDQQKNMSIKALAQIFGISSSAITQLVDPLVRDGHLSRKEDPIDRRKISLALSKKGQQVMEEAKKIRMNALTSMLEILDDNELMALRNIQKKIIEHLPSYEYTSEKTNV